MWETIEHVLLSPNVTIILLFLAFIAIGIVFLTKTDILNIHTQNIQIGVANRERNIIRQQIEWIRLHYEDAEATLDVFHSEEFDERLKEDIKFTIEKLIQIRKMYSSNNI